MRDYKEGCSSDADNRADGGLAKGTLTPLMCSVIRSSLGRHEVYHDGCEHPCAVKSRPPPPEFGIEVALYFSRNISLPRVKSLSVD